MRMLTIFIMTVLFTIPAVAADFQTLTYFMDDSTELQLDLFTPENTTTETPLVIYVHGGGFSGGNRGGGHKLGQHLIQHDIACASITYTLYMKGKNFSCGGVTSEKVKAIQIAANQLWQATVFLLENSDEYNIDITKIFIAGSSAGAETVLHAAFWDKDQMQLYENKLSPEFQYAGLISGAGAIMDLSLITPENKIPTMVFHGDADPTVPYGTAAHHYCPPNATGWLMFFGSQSIAEHFEEIGGICQLTTFVGGTHKYAGAYFYNNQHFVSDFIQRVLAGERFNEYRFVETDE